MIADTPRPTIRRILFIWTRIGLQSFGGGASTSFLIQHEFIDKHKFITMEEYAHFWNLCIFTPGINLVALTILIGRKIGGTWGIVASLAGLLLPSATITCLLAAGFQAVQHNLIIQAVVRGIIPATAGIMLLVGINFARPLLKQVYQEGSVRLIICILFILACATAIIYLKIAVIPVLLVSALLSMLIFTEWRIHPGVVSNPAQSEISQEAVKGPEVSESHD